MFSKYADEKEISNPSVYIYIYIYIYIYMRVCVLWGGYCMCVNERNVITYQAAPATLSPIQSPIPNSPHE